MSDISETTPASDKRASKKSSASDWSYRDLGPLRRCMTAVGDGGVDTPVGQGADKKAIREFFKLGDEKDGKKRPLALILAINISRVDEHLKIYEKLVEDERKRILGEDLGVTIKETDRDGQRRLEKKGNQFTEMVEKLLSQEVDFKPIKFSKSLLNIGAWPDGNPIPVSVQVGLSRIMTDFEEKD